ncbi:LOB domain-containing protein 25-like [Vicia villosa]|uniref:LOB domain-containing protein 25-like n=1 Tax=Vicia villosa TaxID=3911 RepID=UPI00273CB03D|nr:LOB domain-containing protein 25-like [Vicia villosa]
MTNPCAACKHIRRACDPNCELAPYFPADKPHRFSVVHTVFGKSNVSKLLQRLDVTQREQAVDSLVYEAEARMRDPVYGCVSFMWNLQQRLNEIQERLRNVKNELAKYFDHDTVEFVIKNPHYFGFEPRESQQLPDVTAAEQHRNLEQLRQMLLRSDRGFSTGDGGLGHHHMNVHDDYVGPSSGTFEMGGTSTSGYQIQPPPHQ